MCVYVCCCLLLLLLTSTQLDQGPQSLRLLRKWRSLQSRIEQGNLRCAAWSLHGLRDGLDSGVRGRGNEGKTNTWTHRHRKKLKSGGLGSLTEKDQRSRSSVSVACIQLDKKAGLADFCRRGLYRGSGLEAANIQEKAIVGVSVDTVYMYI